MTESPGDRQSRGVVCAIGDDVIDVRPYAEIVKIARDYIEGLGDFEKFAEWGLVR